MEPNRQPFFRIILPIAILLFLLLFLPGFHTNLPTGKSNNDFDNQPHTHPVNDSAFLADSLRLHQLFDKYWYYYNYGKRDSIIWTGEEMIKIGARALAFKQDSVVEFFYEAGKFFFGQGLVFKGRFEEGIAAMEKTVDDYLNKYGVTSSLAEAYVGLGGAYSEMGDYENQLFFFQKAAKVVEQTLPEGDYYYGHCYRNIGKAYYAKGDYNQAIAAYQKAIRSYAKLWPMIIPRAYVELSDVLLKKGDTAGAFDACYKSIELALSKGEDYAKFLPLSYAQLGQVFLESGSVEEGISYLEKAKNLAQKNDDPTFFPAANLISFLSALGRAYTRTGEYGRALETINQAVKLSVDYYGASALPLMYLYMDKGAVFEKMNNWERALLEYQSALHHLNSDIPKDNFMSTPLEGQLPVIPESIDALRAKSIALKRLYAQSPDKADKDFVLSTFNLTQSYIERLLLSYLNRNAQSRLIQQNLAFYEAGIALATSLYAQTNEKRYLDWAFSFMEKSKSAVLLSSLQESRAEQFLGVPEAVLAKEKELRKQAGIYENLYFQENNAEQPNPQMVAYYQDKLFRARKAKDSLRNVLEDDYPQYYQLKYGLSLPSLDDIQKGLGKGEGLIEYFLGDSTLFALSVSRNAAYLDASPADSSFFARVLAFRGLVSNPPAEGDNQEGTLAFLDNSYFLYQKLLERPLGKLGVSKLVIIPDGMLGYLPFHALATAQVSLPGFKGFRSLPYVMDKWCTRQEYSATLMQLQRPGIKKELPYLGFAPKYEGDELMASRGADRILVEDLYGPLVREGLSSLQYNAEEVENATREFSGRSFVGAEAKESQFKAWAPSSRAIHLAMHALTNDREPLYSQLIFSKEQDTLEDGFLYAYEIYNLDLSAADIVVLSACNTGVGKLQRGEGLMSLSRAFKYAGCPNIVMSLWKADDFSTKEIVSSFFTHLKSNTGKAEALQLARREFLSAAGDNRTHPYYWAGLALTGDDEPLGATPLYWLWAIGFGGVVFLFVVIRRFRLL